MPYPTSLDTFIAPSGTSLLTSPDHGNLHSVAGSAINNIEQKIGLGAGTPTTTNKLLVGSGNGTSAWGGTVNNLVMGTPTVTGGAITLAAVGGTANFTAGTISGNLLGTNTIQGGTQTAVVSASRFLGSAAYSGTVSGTTTLNLGTATRHLINMPNSAGAVTLALSNVTANQPFIVEVLQGTAGNGTIVWFSTIDWFNSGTSAPSQGTTPSRKASYGFIATGTANFQGYPIGNQG